MQTGRIVETGHIDEVRGNPLRRHAPLVEPEPQPIRDPEREPVAVPAAPERELVPA